MATREEFVAAFEPLRQEILAELPTTFEMPSHAIKWIDELTKKSVMGGKMNRGLTVSHALKALKGDAFSEKDKKDSIILGWCIEWLQAFFLVADDLMDASVTRRGQPCWYREKRPIEGSKDTDLVGTIAVNDSFILESCIYRLLRSHFKPRSYYVDLLELFHEVKISSPSTEFAVRRMTASQQVTYQTELGQLLDLTSQPGKEPDISLFTLERYNKIVKYKTAFYSFYMPVALSFILAEQATEENLNTARTILLPMGEYFQVQDDYLDCYGSPEVIGKIGRDIEENKCGWLINQALLIATEEQKQLFKKHYGRDDPEQVKIIKKLFQDLNIEGIFKKYEDESYERITQLITNNTSGPHREVYVDLLKKIYKRSL